MNKTEHLVKYTKTNIATMFRPPIPVPLSSGGGGGAGSSVVNSSSSIVINNNSQTGGGSINFTTSNKLALSISNSQNVLVGTTPNDPTSKLTVAAPTGSNFLQLLNTSNNTVATLSVTSEGGLSIATSGSKIQLGSNNLYLGAGSLYIGGVVVNSTAEQLNYISTTPGIAVGLKTLVFDINRNISNINSLSATALSGTIQTGLQPNITSLNTVNINNLSLAGVSITSTSNEINYLHGVTLGTAIASKALVVDSTLNIKNINLLQANTITGTIQTSSQPNITSIGTLTSLSVNGMIGIGTSNPSRSLDIISTTPIIRLGNGNNNVEMSIDANGNLKFNVDKNIAISTNANMIFNGTSTITGLQSLSASSISGTINTASQPNITSIGSLSSLNVLNDITIGTLTRTSDSQRLTLNEPSGKFIKLIKSSSVGCDIQINSFGDLEIIPTRNLKLGVGSSITMYGSISGVLDLTANTLTGVIQTTAQPNITSIGTLTSLNVSSGITAATIQATSISGVIQTSSQPNITSIGSLSNLAVINGITATSIVASSISGVLQTANQPNITNIGTLSTLSVINTINASSVLASTLTGTIQTAAQPNITSIGTLSSLNVTNGINASSVLASTLTGTIQTAYQTNITSVGTLTSLSVANGITSLSVSASTLTGTIQTESQPNITSIGTLTNLNVTNSITTSSIVSSTITGTLLTSLQPNITSIGTLNKLLTSGPIGIGVSNPLCAIDINTNSLSIDPAIKMTNGTVSSSISISSSGLIIDTSGPYITLGHEVGLKFVGGGISGLSSITATSLTGTLQTADQPNITSIGKLAFLNSDYIGVGTTYNNPYRLSVFDSNGKLMSLTDGSNAMFISIINNDFTFNSSNNRLALASGVSLVLNGGTIIGLDNLTANTISGVIQTSDQPNITSIGTLNSLSVGGNINAVSANISGSARISGDLIVDGNLTLTVPLSFSTINSSSGTFNSDLPAVSTTNGGTLTVIGGAAFSQNVIIGTNLTVGGAVLTNTMINSISGATPGTVTAGVFISSDSRNNLTGFNCLTATNINGTIKTAFQPNITTIGNLSNLNVNGYLGVGTTTPMKQLEINSTTGDCLRLCYNKPTESAFMDISVNSLGQAALSPSGGSITINSKINTQQIALGNTTNTIMPLEVGFVPFNMNLAYAFNTNTNAHGVTAAGSTTTYCYSIRALGRILCTSSIDVMSDRRTKTNITELTEEYCSSFIENTTPVSFNWKEGDENKSFGYIAQELIRNGFPDLVNLARDESVKEEIDDDGFINPEGVKFTITYQHIIPILAQNQKKLMKENAELRAKLDAILQMLSEK